MTDNIFADVPSEGNALDIDKSLNRLSENKVDKTASESQTEKKETETKPSQQGENSVAEKQEPFHKHPRWIKTQQELKEYKEKLSEYDKKFKEFEQRGKEISLPQWWKDSYGEDDKSKQSYRNYETATQAERDRIKTEVLQEIDKKNTEEQTLSKSGEEYVETQLSEMKDEGMEFDRNVLLKFMVDFQNEYGAGSLLDAEGNYDFRKSLALMEKMNPKESDTSIDTKKKIASDTMRSKVKATSNSSIPTVSRKALRGSWRDMKI